MSFQYVAKSGNADLIKSKGRIAKVLTPYYGSTRQSHARFMPKVVTNWMRHATRVIARFTRVLPPLQPLDAAEAAMAQRQSANRKGFTMTTISQADLAKMSKEDLAKLVTELAAKNTRKVSFKVSAKQGLSVYGIHSRFPVTLYASQWETLLAHADAIRKFITDNSAQLARKPV